MSTMKRMTTVLIGVVCIMTTASLLGGNQDYVAKPRKELKPQTHCPVMGGTIDSTVYTDIQGQRVYHCCPMCSKKLKADPDSYFEKAAAQGVLFENIQTKCPVSGKPIDKSYFTDFQGRRVYFANEKSKDKFAKEPAKYLAKLDEQSRKQDDHDKHESDRGGHGGHGGGCGM